MDDRDAYRLYNYSGDFNMKGYYKKTFVFAAAEVVPITLGTFLMLYLKNGLPMFFSILVLTVSLIWYIVYHTPVVSALCSVFVLDEDKTLWHVKVIPGRSYAGQGRTTADVEGAMQTARNKPYIVQFIKDIKAGKKRYNIWSGGDKYMKLVDPRLKKETKRFIYVEAVVTTRKYESKAKTLKFVKEYDGIKELIR